MTDYIKREDALEALLYEMAGTGYQDMAMRCVSSSLFCPPADVEPVRHGYWTEKEVISDYKGMAVINEWQSARCSACGKYHTTPYSYYFTNYDYCPNCGAKMDGEKGSE